MSKLVKIDYTSQMRNGGYVLYWKLYFQLWHKFLTINLSIWQKIYGAFLLIIKTPWWLFIKPLGIIFSTKIHYTGYHQQADSGIFDLNIIKTSHFYILGIPYFWYSTQKLNKKDLAYIQKKAS